MGTRHRTSHYHGVYACGLYCNKNIKKGKNGRVFELKAFNQKWCRCPVCTKVRKAHERSLKKIYEGRRIRPKRMRKVDQERQAALREKADRKQGWRHCKRCGTLTPNRFGYCSICWEYFGDKYDLDAIAAWDSGPAIHRRGMGTVCRVGAKTF